MRQSTMEIKKDKKKPVARRSATARAINASRLLATVALAAILASTLAPMLAAAMPAAATALGKEQSIPAMPVDAQGVAGVILAQYAPGYQPQAAPSNTQPPQPLPGPSSGYNEDVAYARRAQVEAATSLAGQRVTWNNPATGTSGIEQAVGIPTSNGQGQLCRQVQEVIIVGGQPHPDSGYLCFAPNYFH
jgi:hypothetical protein